MDGVNFPNLDVDVTLQIEKIQFNKVPWYNKTRSQKACDKIGSSLGIQTDWESHLDSASD